MMTTRTASITRLLVLATDPMTSFVRPSFASIACCLCILTGCKEATQTESSTSTAVSTTASTSEIAAVAPAPNSPQSPSSTTAAASSSVQSAAGGETHEDLTALNVPLYPNVVESGFIDTGALAASALAGVKVEHPKVRQAVMISHDSFDMVYAWYHQKMPSGSEPAAVAASSHTDENGDRMAIFGVGTVAEPIFQRVMIIHGKSDDTTSIHLTANVTR